MGCLGDAGRFALWLIIYVVFLDFQWPWQAPWNWRPRDLFEDVACASPEGLAAQSDVNSGLKVLIPSVGQTGTTSVVAALAELGLRTYHVEEQLPFIRPALLENASATVWARHVSRCRVEAMSLEPLVDSFPIALQASPDAKVIVTWRDFRTWWKSTQLGGMKDMRWHFFMPVFLASSSRMLPWISLYDMLTGNIDRLLKEGAPFHGLGQATLLDMFCFYSFFRFVYGHPDAKMPFRGTNKVSADDYPEEAYIAMIDEIRRLVPPERLLVFDVKKDSWDVLTSFLGLPAQPAGRPFPHPRSKDSLTNDAVWDYATMDKRVAVVGIFLALHVVNYLIVRSVLGFAWRRLCRRSWWKSKSGAKGE